MKTKGSLALAATAADQMGPEPRSTEREEGVGRRFRDHTDIVDTNGGGISATCPERDENELVREGRQGPVVGVSLPCASVTDHGGEHVSRVADQCIVAPRFPLEATNWSWTAEVDRVIGEGHRTAGGQAQAGDGNTATSSTSDRRTNEDAPTTNGRDCSVTARVAAGRKGVGRAFATAIHFEPVLAAVGEVAIRDQDLRAGRQREAADHSEGEWEDFIFHVVLGWDLFVGNGQDQSMGLAKLVAS